MQTATPIATVTKIVLSNVVPVCQDGCTIRCSWCYPQDERFDEERSDEYDDAKGG